jgi:mxaJ protein
VKLSAAAALLLLSRTVLAAQTLTVCADPNNLPFSNREGQGFENRLVAMLAKDMHVNVAYVWWAQRRAFARHTVTQARCDLWPGVASGVKGMDTSEPYYRSSYVFMTRASRNLQGLTLDDPRLRQLIIGVQMIGFESTNTPPAQALAERGLTQNVRGFMLFGDYGKPNPAAAIVTAVAAGDIDVALVWGPVAGYFARQAAVPMHLEPVADDPTWKMSYAVAIGVRRGEQRLLQRVNAILAAEHPAIDSLLHAYRVPLLPLPGTLASR